MVGGDGEADLEPQRLTLADFRRRLVGALLVEEDKEEPVPTRETEVEAIQLFIGVRYLLLAPLYGYSLQTLVVDATSATTKQRGGGGAQTAEVVLQHDGDQERYDLDAFRLRMRAHIREELERVASGSRGAIDLSKVAEAETASTDKDWAKVVSLLGSWPAPLAIFLRTPEGQMLAPEARALIAKGLGLLGSACVHLGDVDQAEEVFRIGIQYASEGLAAAELFRRLGDALLQSGRAGEAIGALRRAIAFGGPATDIMAAPRQGLRRTRPLRRRVRVFARRPPRQACLSFPWPPTSRRSKPLSGQPWTAWKARAIA